MSPADFKRLALRLPEVMASAHMGHPDFRVGGRIFATLGYPKAGWGMVKLTPDQQEFYVRAQPAAWVPANGSWGRQGATTVLLRLARNALVREALLEAWTNRAPKRLKN